MSKQKVLSLKELAKQSAGKIITDDKIRQSDVTLGDTKVEFTYKPLSKGDYLKAQSTNDPGKSMDYILPRTLWNPEKGEKGDFWSIEEINDGLPLIYQTLILNEIILGSGHVVKQSDMDF
ncbi:hypothetical protein MARBORIA2_14950 [Methanobrevibacter arboriphilus]|uniref:hypothetical protein n=1 Tax=Methanobrevibacter arboriphilus TaxID=39441 RepID=UPI0022EE3866|nr:hypothetical protein [Methanobrevibacter arboriphilus]GLI12405.1 hypothetical protein MARBORIA2_14950 [Methanobrevibacter arboriphilus]